jgi:hypothetical protein
MQSTHFATCFHSGFLLGLVLQFWRWRRHISPKRQVVFQRTISKKRERFMWRLIWKHLEKKRVGSNWNITSASAYRDWWNRNRNKPLCAPTPTFSGQFPLQSWYPTRHTDGPRNHCTQNYDIQGRGPKFFDRACLNHSNDPHSWKYYLKIPPLPQETWG